ncbi:MAG: DUF4339 domain-containing protein, partial [Deltaproteobacteria bacterium]|nr:DUF4339 domain-containing protein [Deltaproteobacteria bacterium]
MRFLVVLMLIMMGSGIASAQNDTDEKNSVKSTDVLSDESFGEPESGTETEAEPKPELKPDADSLWYLYVRGVTTGPFSNEQILEFIEQKTIEKGTQIAKAGSDKWVLVSSVFSMPESSAESTPPLSVSVLEQLIKNCSADAYGEVKVKVQISNDGHIDMAKVQGYLGTTSVGDCISGVVLAEFTSEVKTPGIFLYSFMLGGKQQFAGVDLTRQTSIKPVLTSSDSLEDNNSDNSILSKMDDGLPDDTFFNYIDPYESAKRKKFKLEISIGEVGLETGFNDIGLYGLFIRFFGYFGGSNLALGADLFRGSFFSNDKDLMNIGENGELDYVQLDFLPLTLKYSFAIGKKTHPVLGLDLFVTGSFINFEGIEFVDDEYGDDEPIKDYEYSPMATFGINLNGPLLHLEKSNEGMYLTRMTLGYSIGKTDVRSVYAFDGLFLQASIAFG